MANGVSLAASYEEHLAKLNWQRARIAALLGAFLLLGSSVLDYFMHPEQFAAFLTIRISGGLFVMGVYALSFTAWGRKNGLALGMMVALSIGLALNLIIRPLGYESPYYAGLNLIILGVGVLFTWKFHEVLLCSLGVYLMYVVPILVFDEIGSYKIFVNNNLFILETIIIAVAASYFTSKLREHEFESQRNLANAKDSLAEAYSKLSALDQAKTNFFSNISHELRTPLTLILAPIESLLQEFKTVPASGSEGGERLQQDLSVMRHHGLKLLKLINDLLDLARIDAAKFSLSLKPGPLQELVRVTADSVRPLAEAKKIELKVEEEGDLPPFDFDPDNLEKVISNLLFNALKFTPEGGKVSVHLSRKGEEARVEVRDTGIGIPADKLTQVFDRFGQVDPSSKRKYEGTGIGLALSKEVVKLHHGNIWAQSELGKGTSVFFTLPLQKSGAVAPAETPPQLEKQDLTRHLSREALRNGALDLEAVGVVPAGSRIKLTETEPAISRHKIALVEDSRDLLRFLERELSPEFNVVTAHDGVEGWEAISKELPELVVSDVMMPERNGYELCQMIKSNNKTKHIPVILLTAKADLNMRMEGYQAGADDYLVKPFNAQELCAKVRSVLATRESERELAGEQKLAAVGMLAAGMAHEANNAVTAILKGAQHARKLFDKLNGSNSLDPALKSSMEEDLDVVIASSKETLALVGNLMDFSQKNRQVMKLNDLHLGIQSTLAMLKHHLIEKKIKVETQFCGDGKIDCDLAYLNQVFLNLLINAVHFVPQGGSIWVETSRVDGRFCVMIRDNGTGIPRENLNRLFEPFFTTKEIGKGQGLGLYLCYKIVRQHYGHIAIDSEPGKGTRVLIDLPTKQAAMAA